MNNPIIKIGLVSNVFIRQMHFENAGDVEHGHQHQFDHLTLLAKGKLSVKKENEITEFTAPHMIFIAANATHELTALTDNTVAYCVHALREDSGGNIIDPDMVPKGGPELHNLITSVLGQNCQN